MIYHQSFQKTRGPRFGLRFILLGLAVAGLMTAASFPARAQGTGAIHGHVTDAAGGGPLADVFVFTVFQLGPPGSMMPVHIISARTD
ncbi:MAG: hypothetical protein M1457_01365, partial [bacterium]|nr:hypothetical protein [bacterium]